MLSEFYNQLTNLIKTSHHSNGFDSLKLTINENGGGYASLENSIKKTSKFLFAFSNVEQLTVQLAQYKETVKI